MQLTSMLRSLKANRRRSRSSARKQLLAPSRHLARVELLEDRRLLAATWERLEPLGSLMFQSDISGQIGAPIPVFSDGFESGSLGSAWTTTSSTPNGRVEVSDTSGTPAHSGSFHLAMDTRISGPYNLNEAIFTADLSSFSEAGLQFSHKDVDDEDHLLPASFTGSAFGDGVSISEDGTTWRRLVSLNNANSPNGVYTDFEFDLDAEAEAAGISLGSNFQIKFQQYDNYPFNTDGRTFDDVAITAPGPLTETTTVFLEADQTLTVVATPDDDDATLSITVRDRNNTVLASATASGPGETLAIQTIGIATDGDYTVEITGDTATDYNLSLFRNTAVEVVDTHDGNEQDATGSLISLGSARFGIVGEFAAPGGGGDQKQAVVWGIQPNGGESPPALPDLYGDPGEPGRFPSGPNAVAQPTAPNELLVNGSFETGDFTGWTTVTTSGPFRPWNVSGAGTGTGFGMLQTQPQDGTFAAWNGFDGNGPMEFQMYQDVTIAADSTATLSWMDRVQWNFNLGGFATMPRLYDVEIRDPATNSVLQNVFSFSTGTQSNNPTGNTNWQTHSVDMSAFAGETIRVMFREQIPQSSRGPAQIEFDAISLTTGAGPASGPDVDEYLIDLTGMAGQPIDIAASSDIGPSLSVVEENDLAIVISDDPAAAPVAELQATGFFDSITVINVMQSTPTLADLQEFESILTYTNPPPYNAAALGDVLADFVDAGGHLVMATYTFSTPSDVRGRITTSGYSPLTNVGNNDNVSGNLVATVPADPIFDGIDWNAVAYFANAHFAHPGIDEGATLLATDGAGNNMIARNAAGNVVGLNFIPRSGLQPNNQEMFALLGNALLVTRSGEKGAVKKLELLDTDGITVLATAMEGSDNFDPGIFDFVVPADGVYTVRVSGESGKYGIVVTDSLLFDTGPNSPSESVLRSLDNAEGALGFLGKDSSGSDVDLSLINSFESLTLFDSGFIPPDPIVAAGPQSVITMVNTDIAIHNKNTGAMIVKADLDGSGGFWNTNNVVFDPWIIFDPDSERFFAMGIDSSTASGGSSRVYLAVSTDSTPDNLTTDWNKYVINRTGTHQFTGGSTFPDYPKLGVNDDAVYITANDFGILGGGFSHVSLFAIEKAPLLAGGPANLVYDEDITGAFSVHPVVNHDSGAPMQFAEALGATGIRLHTLSNVLTVPARTTAIVAVPTFFPPPDVPQQGGPPLDSVSQRIMSGVVRDGSLWTAHAIRDPAVDTETVVRWYEFDVRGLTPSLVQQGNVDPGPGVHTWMPHINVDQDGDMAIAFSVSGPTQFGSIGYTGRLATDPPGTIRPVEIARTGQAPYARFDGIGRNRWGDYSGLAIDPDGETFWLYNEYAATGNVWRTFVGAFQIEGSEVILESDTYAVLLAGGEQIGLSTSTPFDDPIETLNLLDPSIEILDPNGNTVAVDSNGGADGKNAAIPTFTATIPGTYRVIVGAETEGVGEYVLSVNWAPVIEDLALSSATIFENETVTLSGAYSDQNLDDSHTFVVDWDDPNHTDDSAFALPSINTIAVGDTFASSSDGTVLEITAVDLLVGQVSFVVSSHRYLDDGPAPGNGTAADRSTVTVTVADDGGLVAAPMIQETVVLVQNVQPEIHSLAVSATKGDKAVPGGDVTLAATFADLGLLDRHDVTIVWDDVSLDSVFDVDATADLAVGDTFTSVSGDGAVLTIVDVMPATGEVSFEVESYQFATGGIFDMTLTIEDDDSGVGADGMLAWVTGLRVNDGVLQIVGSSADDHVSINQQGNGLIKVHAGFLPNRNFVTFDADEVDKIVAYLFEGDDHFTIAGNVDITAIVHGDAGDDYLKGGRGPAVLLGGEGYDTLIGGTGSDVLIGGVGTDQLTGGPGADMLIGGSTNSDEGEDALMALSAAWTSDDSYDDRVAATDALLTVIDDEDEDELTGSSGQDLFYDGDSDLLADAKTSGKKKKLETVL